MDASLSVNAKLTSLYNGEKIIDWSVEGHLRTAKAASTKKNLWGLICYGYGASRRMGTTDLSEAQTSDIITSLFDDNATLINPEEWLLQADYAAKSLDGEDRKHAERQRDRIKEMLIRLLPD